ncbi:hypothetical protein HW132_12800 [Brasilonema sp. CT11]|nr:hypothetical protein [Brasilonema sp. CT11]
MNGIYIIYEVKSYQSDGKQRFSKKLARDLLNIRQRQTFNEHLKCLGLYGKPLGWDELKEVLALRLFMYARIGYHTREMYINLKIQGHLTTIFKHLKIDLEAEFEKVKNDYQQRQEHS